MSKDKKEIRSFIDKLKMEIASDLGIDFKSTGANRTAKENGHIGGQKTKKLVELGKQVLNEK